jgi:hypothetical protein
LSFLAWVNPAPMSAEERVSYEQRLGPRFATVAALAAIFLMGGSILQLVGPHTKVEELTLDLITENKRVGLDIGGAVLNAIGWLSLGATMWFLFGATRARSPRSQSFIGIIAILGSLIAAISGIVDELLITSKASEFVHSGAQTYMEANHLTTGGAFAVVPILGLLGALMVALALVLVSLAAMRVGLLSRFMGYLGMFAGALVLIQLTPVPLVQAYWLLALAYLLSGRWPTGVPPAWRTGRAEKWPTSQEIREQRIRAAGQRGRGRSATPAPAPAPQAAGAPTPSAARAGGAGAKRKRKRRK